MKHKKELKDAIKYPNRQKYMPVIVRRKINQIAEWTVKIEV